MTALRPDLAVIAANVAPGSRVLDIGCGDGALLAALRDGKQVDARGMELDPHDVAECVATTAENIEREFTNERLNTLVTNGGWDPLTPSNDQTEDVTS